MNVLRDVLPYSTSDAEVGLVILELGFLVMITFEIQESVYYKGNKYWYLSTFDLEQNLFSGTQYIRLVCVVFNKSLS